MACSYHFITVHTSVWSFPVCTVVAFVGVGIASTNQNISRRQQVISSHSRWRRSFPCIPAGNGHTYR